MKLQTGYGASIACIAGGIVGAREVKSSVFPPRASGSTATTLGRVIEPGTCSAGADLGVGCKGCAPPTLK